MINNSINEALNYTIYLMGLLLLHPFEYFCLYNIIGTG